MDETVRKEFKDLYAILFSLVTSLRGSYPVTTRKIEKRMSENLKRLKGK